MYLRLRKADTSVFGETLYLAVSNTKKKNFPEVLSGVKRGSYDIASFNALLSASPWPHSLAWLKEVHGAGGTRIGWKGVLLYWKRDGIYSIHVKAPSGFDILNLCF